MGRRVQETVVMEQGEDDAGRGGRVLNRWWRSRGREAVMGEQGLGDGDGGEEQKVG